MELGKIIAFNLKRLRMDRNLSQGQLAKEAGISKAKLSDRTIRRVQRLSGILLFHDNAYTKLRVILL